MTGIILVDYDENATNGSKILALIKKVGYEPKVLAEALGKR